jgi:hypothetical protein
MPARGPAVHHGSSGLSVAYQTVSPPDADPEGIGVRFPGARRTRTISHMPSTRHLCRVRAPWSTGYG